MEAEDFQIGDIVKYRSGKIRFKVVLFKQGFKHGANSGLAPYVTLEYLDGGRRGLYAWVYETNWHRLVVVERKPQ